MLWLKGFLTENLSEEANSKWPIGNRMITCPMTSRDPERSNSWPQNLDNSWRCYLATVAYY